MPQETSVSEGGESVPACLLEGGGGWHVLAGQMGWVCQDSRVRGGSTKLMMAGD